MGLHCLLIEVYSNTSYTFNGSSAYVLGNANTNLNFSGNNPTTISAWVNIYTAPSNNRPRSIFSHSNFSSGTVHQQYSLAIDGSNRIYFIAGDGDFESNGEILDKVSCL